MTVKYPTKSVCVVDFGLFLELAQTMTRYFGKVFYHFPWQASAFPRSNSKMVGKGMPGITLAERLWDIVPEVDCFIFPDVFLGDIQSALVAQGKLVFGSRRGDELELYRAESKKHFRSIGAAVGPFEVIVGLPALRTFLKQHKDQYVKCSVNRGDFETFHSPDYRFAEPKIDALEHSLGMKKYIQEFIVETGIPDAVEIGYDGFCIDGQYPAQSLVGIEIKSKGYVGQMKAYDSLPKQVTGFNQKIAPTLKKYQYRNFMSTEIRINKDKKAYILDPCMRCGNPPAATAYEFYDNLGEIIWEGAQGRVVKPTSKFKWAAQIQLSSDWSDTNWLNVQFPEKIRNNVKLINGMRFKDEYYIVPQDYKITSIGAVVAGGQTMQEAIGKCKSLAEQVKGFYVECNPEALDEAEAEWQKLKAFGVDI